jgi:hypothetical protein
MQEIIPVRRETVDGEIAFWKSMGAKYADKVDESFYLENPVLREFIARGVYDYSQRNAGYYLQDYEEKKDHELRNKNVTVHKPYIDDKCFGNDLPRLRAVDLSASCCANRIYDGCMMFYDAIRNECPSRENEGHPEMHHVPFIDGTDIQRSLAPYIRESSENPAPGASQLETFADGVWDRIRRYNCELERLVATFTLKDDIVITEGLNQQTAIIYHLIFERLSNSSVPQSRLF